MQTENLNEMIQPDSKQSTDSDLPDYMYTNFNKKEAGPSLNPASNPFPMKTIF